MTLLEEPLFQKGAPPSDRGAPPSLWMSTHHHGGAHPLMGARRAPILEGCSPAPEPLPRQLPFLWKKKLRKSQTYGGVGPCMSSSELLYLLMCPPCTPVEEAQAIVLSAHLLQQQALSAHPFSPRKKIRILPSPPFPFIFS